MMGEYLFRTSAEVLQPMVHIVPGTSFLGTAVMDGSLNYEASCCGYLSEQRHLVLFLPVMG